MPMLEFALNLVALFFIGGASVGALAVAIKALASILAKIAFGFVWAAFPPVD
jgi:hypothetical protein